MYQIKTNGEMVWLEADALAQADGVAHAFSTRHGGCSAFPYTDLNLGLHTSDDLAQYEKIVSDLCLILIFCRMKW